MKAAYGIFAVLLATVLSGCADYQAQQHTGELNEQAKAAALDCANKFPVITRNTIVAAVRCGNAAWEITSPTLGSDKDLFQAFMADRLAIAEQVQSGKISLTEGEAAITKKSSEAHSEAQRRNDGKINEFLDRPRG
jgi:hypothetical protein